MVNFFPQYFILHILNNFDEGILFLIYYQLKFAIFNQINTGYNDLLHYYYPDTKEEEDKNIAFV